MKKIIIMLSLSLMLVGYCTMEVEASGNSYLQSQLEKTPDDPGYNPAINIPAPYQYENMYIEEGEDGENNSEEVYVTSGEDEVNQNAEGWQYIGYDDFATQSINFDSYGGDIKVEPIVNEGWGAFTIEIWDDDGATGDEHIEDFTIADFPPPYFIVNDIGSFVDGENGTAEVYFIKNDWPNEQMRVDVWD